jgi:hypothetical protein
MTIFRKHFRIDHCKPAKFVLDVSTTTTISLLSYTKNCMVNIIRSFHRRKFTRPEFRSTPHKIYAYLLLTCYTFVYL